MFPKGRWINYGQTVPYSSEKQQTEDTGRYSVEAVTGAYKV